MGKVVVEIPGLKLASEANAHEHWRKRQRRAKAQRASVWLFMVGLRDKLPPLPVRVRITRIASRRLDSDNNVGAAKHVRDQIADTYGVDDRSDLYEWEYAQEQARACGVRIEIQSRDRLSPTPPAKAGEVRI